MTTLEQPTFFYQSPTKSQPDTEAEETNQIFIRETQQIKGRSKIKSSLCKNFMLIGACPYGIRCQFAHGTQQLRCNAVVNTSYKTKHCFSFIKKGICPYGDRCNFIHKEENTTKKSFLENLVQNLPELITEIGPFSSRLLSKI